MLDAFFYTIVPNSKDMKAGKEGCLSNSPYGDIYDIILPVTSSGVAAPEVLSPYKVCILLGEHEPDPDFVKRQMEYVEAGGTLILNISQINKYYPYSFLGIDKILPGKIPFSGNVISEDGKRMFVITEPYEYNKIVLSQALPFMLNEKGDVLGCINNYGKGKVILTAVDYMMPKSNANKIYTGNVKLPFVSSILDRMIQEIMPVRVEGDIEYGLNKSKNGWILYLINNNGVTKYAKTPQQLDPGMKSTVKIHLKDIHPSSIRNLRSDEKIKCMPDNGFFMTTVYPGDVKVIEIKEN